MVRLGRLNSIECGGNELFAKPCRTDALFVVKLSIAIDFVATRASQFTAGNHTSLCAGNSLTRWNLIPLGMHFTGSIDRAISIDRFEVGCGLLHEK